MGLQQEIDKARGEIRTDAYSMSIGELVSLYEKKEIDIHPEFQRFFRWTPIQKSRLIESIFLGIPIPQIFVAQRPDGVWDVVDGLQRLSTIYQLVGVLRDEEGGQITPFTLEATKYLPSLEGRRWEDPANPDRSLTPAQKLLIKRAKIDVSIILRESFDVAKYELFQRLNTGGSQLSDQEVRNSILVMLNPSIYRWLKELAGMADFQECVALSDRAIEEQYDMELVTRYVIFRIMPETQMGSLGDIGDFLTDRAAEIAQDKAYNTAGDIEGFSETFRILNGALGSDAFRRFDPKRGKFVGGFSVSAFEAIALGVGYNYRRITYPPTQIVERIKALWSDPMFLENSGSGVRASSRVPRIVPYGRRIFAA